MTKKTGCRTRGPLPGTSRAKVRYVREASAWSTAVMMGLRQGEKFEHYQCRECRFWHVGRPRIPKPPPRLITRDEALDDLRTLARLEEKDRRRHLVAMAAMQPRRLP